MKYWKVEAKCGHVGRNKFVIKSLYIKAETGEEAAEKARITPRVKHNHPDAIRSVEKISLKRYVIGKEAQDNDPYFKVKNKQDQNLLCLGLDMETYYEKDREPYKKETHDRRRLVERQRITE